MAYQLFTHPSLPMHYLAQRAKGGAPLLIPASASGQPQRELPGGVYLMPTAQRVIPASTERLLLEQYGLTETDSR